MSPSHPVMDSLLSWHQVDRKFRNTRPGMASLLNLQETCVAAVILVTPEIPGMEARNLISMMHGITLVRPPLPRPLVPGTPFQVHPPQGSLRFAGYYDDVLLTSAVVMAECSHSTTNTVDVSILVIRPRVMGLTDSRQLSHNSLRSPLRPMEVPSQDTHPYPEETQAMDASRHLRVVSLRLLSMVVTETGIGMRVVVDYIKSVENTSTIWSS